MVGLTTSPTRTQDFLRVPNATRVSIEIPSGVTLLLPCMCAVLEYHGWTRARVCTYSSESTCTRTSPRMHSSMHILLVYVVSVRCPASVAQCGTLRTALRPKDVRVLYGIHACDTERQPTNFQTCFYTACQVFPRRKPTILQYYIACSLPADASELARETIAILFNKIPTRYRYSSTYVLSRYCTRVCTRGRHGRVHTWSMLGHAIAMGWADSVLVLQYRY